MTGDVSPELHVLRAHMSHSFPPHALKGVPVEWKKSENIRLYVKVIRICIRMNLVPVILN